MSGASSLSLVSALLSQFLLSMQSYHLEPGVRHHWALSLLQSNITVAETWPRAPVSSQSLMDKKTPNCINHCGRELAKILTESWSKYCRTCCRRYRNLHHSRSWRSAIEIIIPPFAKYLNTQTFMGGFKVGDMVTMTNETSDTGDTCDHGASVVGARTWHGLTRSQCLVCFVPSAKTDTSSVNTFIRYLKYANVDSSKESLGLFIFKLRWMGRDGPIFSGYYCRVKMLNYVCPRILMVG